MSECQNAKNIFFAECSKTPQWKNTKTLAKFKTWILHPLHFLVLIGLETPLAARTWSAVASMQRGRSLAKALIAAGFAANINFAEPFVLFAWVLQNLLRIGPGIAALLFVGRAFTAVPTVVKDERHERLGMIGIVSLTRLAMPVHLLLCSLIIKLEFTAYVRSGVAARKREPKLYLILLPGRLLGNILVQKEGWDFFLLHGVKNHHTHQYFKS